jgi:hypothetical protein
MKRLLVALGLVSVLVMSQAGPAYGLSSYYISPASQTTRMGTYTSWFIGWNGQGQVSWWFDYGDGTYSAATSQGGTTRIYRSHKYPCENRTWTQTLTLTDYGTPYPWQHVIVRSSVLVYGYCL